MAAIVPSTPPTLRKVDHSPGGTPHADRSAVANSSMSQIDQFLGSALKDKFKHMNGSPEEDESGGLGRTDSDSSACKFTTNALRLLVFYGSSLTDCL